MCIAINLLAPSLKVLITEYSNTVAKLSDSGMLHKSMSQHQISEDQIRLHMCMVLHTAPMFNVPSFRNSPSTEQTENNSKKQYTQNINMISLCEMLVLSRHEGNR